MVNIVYQCTCCNKIINKPPTPVWLCECGKPLYVHYEWEGIIRDILIDEKIESLWRYVSVLPEECLNENISFSSPISLGLEDQIIFDYKIYPNPTSNTINIQGDISDLKVIIYDILGKVLMQDEAQESIDISFLKKGTYFLFLTNNSINSTYKIIKK